MYAKDSSLKIIEENAWDIAGVCHIINRLSLAYLETGTSAYSAIRKRYGIFILMELLLTSYSMPMNNWHLENGKKEQRNYERKRGYKTWVT